MSLIKDEVILTLSIFMSKLRLYCNLKSGHFLRLLSKLYGLDKLGTNLTQCVTLVIHHAGSDYLAKNMKYVSGQTFLSYGVINLNIFFFVQHILKERLKKQANSNFIFLKFSPNNLIGRKDTLAKSCMSNGFSKPLINC